MRIGFIGAGIMGSRMAANLAKEHDVRIWNRDAAKAAAVPGCTPVASIAELEAPIVLSMLAHPDAVDAVKDEILASLDGGLWVDCSTVNPAFARRIAKEANERNVRFVDAPVAGSAVPAAKGELVTLVGGDENDVVEAQPIFDIVGKRTIHAGPVGAGASLKLVVNTLLGASMAAFAEALKLGEAEGLDRGFLLDLLPDLPVTAPIVALKRERLKRDDYSVEFPAEWMAKDLRLALETAKELGAELPLANLLAGAYARLPKRDDFSAIVRGGSRSGS